MLVNTGKWVPVSGPFTQLISQLYTELYIPGPKHILKKSLYPINTTWQTYVPNVCKWACVCVQPMKNILDSRLLANSQVQWPSWAVIVSKSIACLSTFTADKVIYEQSRAAHYDVMLIHYSYLLQCVYVQVNLFMMPLRVPLDSKVLNSCLASGIGISYVVPNWR